MWCPLAPDQYYELNLSIPEERHMAQMLVKLAIDEPGENWQDETFGWTREEPMPGWELNVGWLKPGGIPEKGFLCLTYYSGADLGCAPIWPTRRELMESVLAEPPQDFDAFAETMSLALENGSQAY